MSATLEQAEQILDDGALVEETLLDELENEEIPSHIREARLSQLKKMTQDFEDMRNRKHGEYSDISDEKAFLELTTTEERCIVHFYHTDFRRCAIMDGHLSKLATKHFNTKFAKINVEKAKFFVSKLKIQVLPAVLCFMKGVVVDRIIGFEDISGEGDNFSTEALERRLAQSSVIMLSQAAGGKKTTANSRTRQRSGDSDDSD